MATQPTHSDDATPAAFFALGEILHTGIQGIITDDLTVEEGLALVHSDIEDWINGLDSQPIQTQTRTIETMADDAERMIRSWFRWIHPSSPDRLELLNSYQWPPRTEVPFHLSPEESGTRYGVWGTVDTVWTPKPGTNLAPLTLDWKSSIRRQWDSGRVSQLDFYRMGLGMPEADAGLIYLDRVQKRAVFERAAPYPGDARVRRGVLAAEDAKDRILEEKVARFTPGPLCRTCPVRPSCPKLAKGRDKEEKMADLRQTLRLLEPMTELMVMA